MPDRIQLRRTPGWRKPPGAVVVARPSKWGSPFTVAQAIEAGFDLPHRAAVSHFTAWFEGHPDYPDTFRGARTVFDRRWMREHLGDLTGRDLACWCPLRDEHGEVFPCHADVLLTMSAQEAPGTVS
jgi:hypothetical protein